MKIVSYMIRGPYPSMMSDEALLKEQREMIERLEQAAADGDDLLYAAIKDRLDMANETCEARGLPF